MCVVIRDGGCFNLRIESLVIESHHLRRLTHAQVVVSISELRVLLLRASLSIIDGIFGIIVSISELRVLLLRDATRLCFNLRIESCTRVFRSLCFNLRIESLVIERLKVDQLGDQISQVSISELRVLLLRVRTSQSRLVPTGSTSFNLRIESLVIESYQIADAEIVFIKFQSQN